MTSVSTQRSSICVRMCPSAHTGRPWLSISTHISTLVRGLSTLTLPVDCSGSFGPCGLSVQYTQDVRGCLSAHTGRPCVSGSTHRTSVAVCVCPCVSVSTHRTSVAVHQYTYQHDVRGCPPAHTGRLWLSVCVCVCLSAHTGRLWLSISTHISMLVLGLSTLALPVDCLGDFWPTWAVCSEHTGRLWVSASTHMTFVAVRGCPPSHTGRLWLSVCVRVCPSAHTGCPWVSVSTQRTSVCVRQHTQDVRGYPSGHISALHTGRPWVSVSTHRTSVCVCQHTKDVRVCPSAHTGRPWLSISTHISTLVRGLSMLTLPVDCSGNFGPRGLSVQYTQDVCVSVSTNRTSVRVRQHTQDVRGCPCVSVSTHRMSVAVHQYTYQQVGPWTQHADPSRGLFGILALPVDCLGDFWPTWAVCSEHTGRPWVSASTHMTSVAVRGCPPAHTGRPRLSVCVRVCLSAHTGCLWVSVSTHRTSVCVRQHTQDVRGYPSGHISALHTGRPWVSVSTHRTSVCVRQHTKDVRVCPCVSVSTHKSSVAIHQYTYQHVGPWTQHADRGLFGTHRTSVAVRECPCVSVSTHRTSVAVHQYTYQQVGPWTQHADPSHGLFGTHKTSVAVRECPCVSVSTHRTSVAVHQYTYQQVGPWTQHADPSRGLFGTSEAVRACPSAHTGRPWLSISTHISTLVLALSTLALPVDCLGDFWPTWVVCSVHTGRPWLSTSHTGRPWLSVGVRQHTQDVCGCPCVSVCVHLCPSAHTGRLWLSISTLISTLVLGLSTLTFPVDYLGDFGPRGLCVQYTQDVCGCPPAYTGSLWLSVTLALPVDCLGDFWPTWAVCSEHTGRPWVSASTHMTTHMMSVGIRQHTQDVCVCPSAHTSRPWLSISTHISTLVRGLSMLTLPVDCSGNFCPCGLSIQYTQDVCGCPSAHTGRPCVSVSTHRTSVAVRECPCVSISTHRTSVAVHQYTYQQVGPWTQHLTLPVDCSGNFGPCGLSVQYTQYVCGCPSAHTGRPCVSVSTHRMSVAVRECPCVSVSTHRTSVAVHQYTYQQVGPWTQHADPSRGLFGTSVAVRACPSAHTGHPWLSIRTHISTLVLGLSTLALPVDCLGDFWPTWVVCSVNTGRLLVSTSHTGRPWLSVGVRQHTQDCPCVSVCVHLCPSAHTGRLWLSISTLISTLVLGLSTLTFPVDYLGDFGPRGLCVQYTQDVRGCPPAYTGRLWLSVCVRVCPSAHTGRLWLSISTHISTLVLGLSTLALPVDCLGDFWPTWAQFRTHRTSVGVRQHTHDVCGCPWVSACHVPDPR
ncbi:hypothetical protein IGI04_042428 [Brassica rapa subsp. trilocularis]|uniref:EGF-like domain-containing protein n=1 Tax=Brassica rapa subsp. trilocularis TaxID=1813537 RepID=A0ABQ7KL53_BRACM|nr:hypothetical protein IGI04_042428 [Brassica rapa subsp. trilocularis]